MKIIKFALVGALFAVGTTAHAENDTKFSLGAGVIASTDFYKNYDKNVIPLPVINFESGRFYFRTLGAGYNLWKNEHHQFAINTYYSALQFNPSDTDNQQLKQLNKRRSTMMAGVIYRHNADWGIIRTAFSADVLNNSNGLLADAAYLYTIDSGNWHFVPGIGVLWASKKQNKYYVGVSQNEANRSGLSSYQPGDSWSPYVEMTLGYKITKNWKTLLVGRVTKLDNEINDSPMVAKDYNTTLAATINYQF